MNTTTKKYICAHCGTTDRINRVPQGTLLGEIALWVLCLVLAPVTVGISIGIAVVFSLWRAMDKKKICAVCQKDQLVKISTPRGQRLIAEYPPE